MRPFINKAPNGMELTGIHIKTDKGDILRECICHCGNKFLWDGDKRTKGCGCLKKLAAKNLPSIKYGMEHPCWKGGIWLSNGYLRTKIEGKEKAVHVIIAEKALGRELKKGEVVHHINGIKNDNRNKNLLICTQAYHKSLSEKMAHLYQKEHFGGE